MKRPGDETENLDRGRVIILREDREVEKTCLFKIQKL